MLSVATSLRRLLCKNFSLVLNMNYVLLDETDKQMFIMEVKEHLSCIVDYEKMDNVYKLVHSEVPVALRGQGFGHILAKKTFDYIAENNYQMSISCTFLLKCYKENESKYNKYFVDSFGLYKK